jgi:hypothetical protein
MGQATDLTQALVQQPLTSQELTVRRDEAIAPRDAETTLDGKVVERVRPAVNPAPAIQAAPRTWD